MKRHVKYIVCEVSPCKIGNNHRYLLEFHNESSARLFIRSWYSVYDWEFTCLQLMKVLA